MLSAVLDTVVFVRCLLNPRGIWGRIVFEHSQEYHLILSESVIAEILEVIRRPELIQKFHSLVGLGEREMLDILAAAEVVEVGVIPPVSWDPDDDKFLATAAAAGADYLVSEDRDLLDIAIYEGVRIVTAEEFLRILTEEAGRR